MRSLQEETKDGVDMTLGIDGLVNKMIVNSCRVGAMPCRRSTSD